jgi:hypothetical protein
MISHEMEVFVWLKPLFNGLGLSVDDTAVEVTWHHHIHLGGKITTVTYDHKLV